MPEPPAIVREAELSEAEILKALKDLKKGILLDKRAFAIWLDRLKKKVGYGRWEDSCRKIGLTRKAADHRIERALANKPIPSDLAEMERMEEYESAFPGTGEVDAEPTAASPNGKTASPIVAPFGTSQIYCRDCRTRGVKPGCRKCIEFRKTKATLFNQNAEQAAAPALAVPVEKPPEPDKPPEVIADANGEPVPEHALAAWQCTAIETWIKNHGRPAYKALAGLEGEPGTVHTDVEAIRKRHHAMANMLRASQPRYKCPWCNWGGCPKCRKAGFMSKALLIGEQKKEEARKEREAREEESHDDIPG